jgi:DNA-binding transcriptional LysR family regulator
MTQLGTAAAQVGHQRRLKQAEPSRQTVRTRDWRGALEVAQLTHDEALSFQQCGVAAWTWKEPAHDLQYFLACVEAGSITRAARQVHVAQPTLSHALSRLEAELGVRVLERRARAPLAVTDAGQRLVERARQALAALSALRDDLAEVAAGTRGQLRLCAVQSACASLLPRALAEFSRSQPGIELSVRTLAAEKIAKAVLSGQADLGFVAGAPSSALRDVHSELLRREELVALVRKSDPLAKRQVLRLSALAERPLVLVPAGTFTGEIIHAACRAAGRLPAALRSGAARGPAQRSDPAPRSVVDSAPAR